HLLRLLDRDAIDARVGVGRAHHRRVRLALELQIVGEAPGPRQEARIFLARERLADHSARAPGLRRTMSSNRRVQRSPWSSISAGSISLSGSRCSGVSTVRLVGTNSRWARMRWPSSPIMKS